MQSLIDFGESSYGKRLDYKPVYRDLWAAVLYLMHMMLIIVTAIYLWATQMGDVTTNSGGTSSLDFAGVLVTLLVCMFGSGLFSMLWLSIIKRYAESIIKGMFYLTIGSYILVAIVGIAVESTGMVIAGLLVALFVGLYAWCVWGRIPFASALLSISSTITKTYPGTVFVSLAVIVANIFWFVIWCSAFIAYVLSTSSSDDDSDTDSGTDTDSDSDSTDYNGSGFLVFLFLVSFYWGFQVNKNVSHTTSCGVAATWYFSLPDQIHKPVTNALRRTLTTSFGSVCLGSLIVAILQALRAMLESNKRRNACGALAVCLLNCIRSLVEYFNIYAFAHVAIYGKSFVESGKAAWNLLTSRGIQAIINDDLTGMVISLGAFIGMFVGAALGTVSFLFYDENSDDDWYPEICISLIVIGGIIGLAITASTLMVVRSCIVTLFVCYAEDPAVMYQNRPQEYQMVTGAHQQWAVVYTTYGYPAGGQQPQQGGVAPQQYPTQA